MTLTKPQDREREKIKNNEENVINLLFRLWELLMWEAKSLRISTLLLYTVHFVRNVEVWTYTNINTLQLTIPLSQITLPFTLLPLTYRHTGNYLPDNLYVLLLPSIPYVYSVTHAAAATIPPRTFHTTHTSFHSFTSGHCVITVELIIVSSPVLHLTYLDIICSPYNTFLPFIRPFSTSFNVSPTFDYHRHRRVNRRKSA